jgi:hypothetical protein
MFISAPNSPTYRDFMTKKSLESKRSKSHTWAPFKAGMRYEQLFLLTVLASYTACFVLHSLNQVTDLIK